MCPYRKFSSHALAFVPKHNPVSEVDVRLCGEFISKCKNLLVITGAGISTESGIPDYRSEGVGLYARSNNKPLQYQKFIQCYESRRRYWARNYVGWQRFSDFIPNKTHEILRDLEINSKKISCLITQNVDNLHFKAGSKYVIELHGTAFTVCCLKCLTKYNRYYIQQLIKDINPNFAEISEFIRPDGDVELTDEAVRNFNIPLCPNCNGILKPDIVFFGENVPKITIAKVDREIDYCDGVLVIGSSLSTYSGFRIPLKCKELKKPLGIINIGRTRADDIADFKIERRCGELLSKLDLTKFYPYNV